MPVFNIKATGRGAYQRTRVTKNGFPRGYLPRTKTVRDSGPAIWLKQWSLRGRSEASIPAESRSGVRAPSIFRPRKAQSKGSPIGTAASIAATDTPTIKVSIPPMPEVRGRKRCEVRIRS